MKLLRSWFLDHAGHRIDLQLSSAVFAAILSQRNQPLHIGSTANQLHEFEGFRQISYINHHHHPDRPALYYSVSWR